MAEKSKKKSRKSGHSPVPRRGGGPCGHSGCGPSCSVRYCGPTSHPFHHHSYTAARGMEHIWLATIAAGLALVITGFVAYNAAQASVDERQAARDQQLIQEIQSLKRGY